MLYTFSNIRLILASKSPIVFHAEMGSDKTYNKGSIWVYDKLVTNIGNAYNPSTGKFSAPTTGIYQFNWNTLCNPGSMAHAGLFVNGKFTANQVYNNGGGIRLWITAGSSIAFSLKKGDEVYIMDVHGGTAPTLRSYFTAFGGVRIY